MRALEDLNTVGRTCTRQLYEPMFIVSKGDCSKLEGAKFPDLEYAKQRIRDESGGEMAEALNAEAMISRGLSGRDKTVIYIKVCDSL